MKISEAIVGTKVGRLTIINISGERNKHNKLIAECLCDCGNITFAIINNIGNQTNSCGCIKAEGIFDRMSKDIKHNTATQVFLSIKRKTPETDLVHQDVMNLIFSNCFYCEKLPVEVGTNKAKFGLKERFTYRVGVDRINNDIGYYKSNSVPCCISCNKIKRANSINFILNYFNIISANAKKLADGFKFIPNGNLNFIIEHINECQCFSNRNFIVPINDRVVKIARNKMNFSGHDKQLSLTEIEALIFYKNCFYCERLLGDVGSLYKRNEYGQDLCKMRAFGIDRIDSNLGYVIDNVVPCCKNCNHTKREYSAEHFSIATQNIYDKISILYNENKIMMGETL
jgi:hypothetical protein